PVAGLMVGKVLLEAASVHLLLMSSLVALTFTVGSMAVEAVAMRIPFLPKTRPSSPWEQADDKNLRSRDPGRTGQPHSVAGFVPANLQAVLPASRQRQEPTPAQAEKQGK